MLNPHLNLNQKLFDQDIDQKPTRNGYGEGLVKLGESNPNVVVMTADLSDSTRCEKFAEKFPDRFIECGVAEQNMAAIAAGFGVSRQIPFISSYPTSRPAKHSQTILTHIVHTTAPVKT